MYFPLRIRWSAQVNLLYPGRGPAPRSSIRKRGKRPSAGHRPPPSAAAAGAAPPATPGRFPTRSAPPGGGETGRYSPGAAEGFGQCVRNRLFRSGVFCLAHFEAFKENTVKLLRIILQGGIALVGAPLQYQQTSWRSAVKSARVLGAAFSRWYCSAVYNGKDIDYSHLRPLSGEFRRILTLLPESVNERQFTPVRRRQS